MRSNRDTQTVHYLTAGTFTNELRNHPFREIITLGFESFLTHLYTIVAYCGIMHSSNHTEDSIGNMESGFHHGEDAM